MVGLCLLCEKDQTDSVCDFNESLSEENRNLMVNNDDLENLTEPLLKKSKESDTNSLGVRLDHEESIINSIFLLY